MKRIKHIICLLAVALAGSGSLNAQGLGFYLGGKRVELVEGDSINFVNNDKGQVEVKVNKDGQVEVYRGEEMTFYGDIERYLLDINNAMSYVLNSSYHNGFGYGASALHTPSAPCIISTSLACMNIWIAMKPSLCRTLARTSET